jgi:hypothetical protein
MTWVLLDIDGKAIELTDDENTLISVLPDRYSEQIAVVYLLKRYQNADRVLAVLRLQGRGRLRRQSKSSIGAVIVGLGARSPEDYITCVETCNARLRLAWLAYLSASASARTATEQDAALAAWKAALDEPENETL